MASILSGSNMEQIVAFSLKKTKKKKKDKKQKSISTSATFHPERLAAVMYGMEKYPALVVSITGVFRSGKSFLVNLMITYLQYLSENVSDEEFSFVNLSA